MGPTLARTPRRYRFIPMYSNTVAGVTESRMLSVKTTPAQSPPDDSTCENYQEALYNIPILVMLHYLLLPQSILYYTPGSNHAHLRRTNPVKFTQQLSNPPS